MTLVRFEPLQQRLRARRGIYTLVDSTAAQLVFVEGSFPEYYIPESDVGWHHLGELVPNTGEDVLGRFDSVNSLSGEAIGRFYVSGVAAGLVCFDFEAMDQWLEEDRVVVVHPKDPYRRVDILASSRTLTVQVAGVQVCTTDQPTLVVETGLPARWYVPRQSVDWRALTTSDTVTGCPYKGVASWWNVRVADAEPVLDLVWGYEDPVAEASELKGLVCFYEEHEVVTVHVDGELAPKPDMSTAKMNPSLALVNQNLQSQPS